jgi:hypothetical protein
VCVCACIVEVHPVPICFIVNNDTTSLSVIMSAKPVENHLKTSGEHLEAPGKAMGTSDVHPKYVQVTYAHSNSSHNSLMFTLFTKYYHTYIWRRVRLRLMMQVVVAS